MKGVCRHELREFEGKEVEVIVKGKKPIRGAVAEIVNNNLVLTTPQGRRGMCITPNTEISIV